MCDLLTFNLKSNQDYDGYFGTFETYKTFKELVRIYLNRINLYYYKGKYHTFSQLGKVYDLNSIDHSNFLKEYNLNFESITSGSGVEEDIEVLTRWHPEVIGLTFRCINVKDPQNLFVDTLGNLELDLIPYKTFQNLYLIENHKLLSDAIKDLPNKTIKLNLIDIW
jgi:hypothetical protein